MDAIIAVYARYGNILHEPVDTIEDGMALLGAMSEEGMAFAIGVYQSGTVYVNEDMGSTASFRKELLSQKLDDLRRIGLEPKRVKVFDLFE